MLDKPDGGLAIRNLRIVQTVFFFFFFKNSLNLINKEDVFWVNIIEHKYGKDIPWKISIPTNCSWFFRSLCKTLESTKSNQRIKTMKPNCTSVLEDSWIFDMPISVKPSFVNMDLIDESLHLNDFIHNDRWSLSHIHQFLSPHINFESLNLGSIDDNNHNIWSWSSKSQGHGIISEVYKTLNASQAHMDS